MDHIKQLELSLDMKDSCSSTLTPLYCELPASAPEAWQGAKILSFSSAYAKHNQSIEDDEEKLIKMIIDKTRLF